jgi:hypothetical protein
MECCTKPTIFREAQPTVSSAEVLLLDGFIGRYLTSSKKIMTKASSNLQMSICRGEIYALDIYNAHWVGLQEALVKHKVHVIL